jgi:hypothetical protein
MSWKRIYENQSGVPVCVVEQDTESGNVTIRANTIELTPDEAAGLASVLSTAVFPFQKSSREKQS